MNLDDIIITKDLARKLDICDFGEQIFDGADLWNKPAKQIMDSATELGHQVEVAIYYARKNTESYIRAYGSVIPNYYKELNEYSIFDTKTKSRTVVGDNLSSAKTTHGNTRTVFFKSLNISHAVQSVVHNDKTEFLVYNAFDGSNTAFADEKEAANHQFELINDYYLAYVTHFELHQTVEIIDGTFGWFCLCN